MMIDDLGLDLLWNLSLSWFVDPFDKHLTENHFRQNAYNLTLFASKY